MPQSHCGGYPETYESDDHGSVAVPAIQDGLRFIYPAWWIEMNNPDNVVTYPILQEHFKKLSKEYGYTIPVSEQFLVSLGFLNIDLKKFDDAIRSFQQAVNDYPNSTGALYCLGLGFMNKGDKVQAIKTFEKYLSLRPHDAQVMGILDRLKNKK